MARNVLGYRLKGRAGVKSHRARPNFARLWVRTAGRKSGKAPRNPDEFMKKRKLAIDRRDRMDGAINQVIENRVVMMTQIGSGALTLKMLKMKIGLDELLKTKGKTKCSGWFDENKRVIAYFG
jgi:hypothetical protein